MKNVISLFLYALLGFSALFSTPCFTEITPIYKYIEPISITEKKPGIAGIDCIYVINMDARVEKWKRVKALFDQQGLKVNRVSGVNGYIISEDERRELSGPYPVRLRGTQIGCLLSHLSIIHDAYKRGFQTIWIMEDDIEFLKDIHEIPPLLQTLGEKDPLWDIFYTDVDWRRPDGTYLLSFNYDPRPDQPVPFTEYKQPREKITPEIMRIRQRWGTHSMILSKAGIKKIVDYYNRLFLWVPIDADLHYIPQIREYASTHDIVSNWNQSLISDTVVACKEKVAFISNWAIDSFPSKFERVRNEYIVRFFSTQECEQSKTLNSTQYKKIILFNPYLSPKAQEQFPKSKVILFMWEPELLPASFYDDYARIYTWDDSLIDNKKFFKFYYPHLQPMSKELIPFEKKKLCTLIASNWVPHRLKMLNFFALKHETDLDFYGKTCPEKNLEPMYKGPISGTEKINTLKNYRFCLCSENKVNLQGYVTEKIFDCFAAGCVPVYLGAANIETYIPKDCFIDQRDFSTMDELHSFLISMTKETYERYLTNIQKYLNSEKADLFSQENFDALLYEAITQ
jgi:GR25 family glycosyltransferase involved in LPS biosynthesis